MSFHRLRRNLGVTLLGGAVGGLALAATSAAPAAANVEVGATAGPHMFSENDELGVDDREDATSLRNSVFFGLRLGYYFSDMLGVELEAGAIPSEGRDQVFDVWTLAPRVQLVAQFGAADASKKLIPFVVLGGGINKVMSSDEETVIAKDTDEQLHIGAGIKYRVENGWGLRVDLRGNFVPSSADESLTAAGELLLSVYKEFGRKAPEKVVDEVIDEPVVGDADGDGLDDNADAQCPNEPEDMDGFQDEDGCPDPDNDNDGVGDAADECDADMEDMDGFKDDDGCPDPDNDGDGVADAADQCKDEAEDADGFQDEDGCPDPDNDGDGVADAQDQCQGEMETANGYKDGDGCADEIPKEVAKFTGAIQGITFKPNSAEIAKSSFKVLGKVVKVLTDFPEVKLEIQGHTSDEGDRDANVALSQARADSVKEYLVSAGVDAARLETKGFGPDVPTAPYEGLKGAKLKKAREKNRRVEFKLIQ
jgi:OOP family OmpA-OmpF porin